MGSTDPLIAQSLAVLPADGAAIPKKPLSDSQAAAKLMESAEKAFARGEYATAAQLHKQALALDPKNYPEDLREDLQARAAACEWFARAVAIDPDTETAHRYWADALFQQGKIREATDQYVEAVVADPYNRLTRERFRQFCDGQQPPLRARAMRLPSGGVVLKDGKTEIRVAPGDDTVASVLSLAYAVTCASFRTDEFTKQFPKEKKQRRSLPEEVAGLRALNEAAQAMLDTKSSHSSPKTSPSGGRR